MTEEKQTEVSWERSIIEKALLAQVKEQASQRRWRIFFRVLIICLLVFMAGMAFKNTKPKPILKEHVALLDLDGVVGDRNGIMADEVATGLRQAFESDKVRGIILRINSPGGSPVQSAYIYDEVRRLRALYPDTKVYAVITDMGASGGYFIAASADHIYANASSIVGSIGVVMMNLGFVEAAQKLGVEQRSMSAGRNKVFLDPLSPQNESQIEFAQSLLDNVHKHFIKAVKDGRGERLKETKDMFSGLFWTGDQALALGLVDGLGSAGYVAREVIGVEEIIDYTVSNNFLDRLASRFGTSIGQSFKAELGFGQQKLQ
ncbi:MAG: S49 family peptidase [Candidatus Berkiella sp.]